MAVALRDPAGAIDAASASANPHVLFVINSLGAGGAERSLAESLPLLRDRGITASVACLTSKREGVEDDVVAGGFPVYFLHSGSLAGRVRELHRLIGSVRPDVVHTAIFEADFIGRLASMRTGVSVVTSIVNTSYDRVRFNDPNIKPYRLRSAQMIDGWTARHMTHHFHALTPVVRDSAVEALGIRAERVTVIPRGRDRTRLGAPGRSRRSRIRSDLGLTAEQPVLINAARQEFQKGQRHLIEALPSVVEAHPSSILLIAGREGHASQEVAAAIEATGMHEHVRLLGHRDDIPDLMAAADLFVFPSLYEGLGGALIEAMALGLPIVTTDIPTLRAVVDQGSNALLTPPGDAASLAAAIVELLGDRERRREFSRHSRDVFERRFDIDEVMDATAEMYRSVIARRDAGVAS